MIKINAEVFFDRTNSDNFITKIDYNKINVDDYIIMFKNISWKELQALFRANGLIISGGSVTKRHLISPNQLKLISFINIINRGNLEDVNSCIAKFYPSDVNHTETEPVSREIDKEINVNKLKYCDITKIKTYTYYQH